MMFIAMFFVVIGLVGLIDAIIQNNRYKNKYNRDNDNESMG